jgi:hypothetical protein
MKSESLFRVGVSRSPKERLAFAVAALLLLLPSGCHQPERERPAGADRFEKLLGSSAPDAGSGLSLRAVPWADTIAAGAPVSFVYVVASPERMARVRIDPGLLYVRVADSRGREVRPEAWEEAAKWDTLVWLTLPASGFFARQLDLRCFDVGLDASSARPTQRCRAHWALGPGSYTVTVSQQVVVQSRSRSDTVALKAPPFGITVRP